MKGERRFGLDQASAAIKSKPGTYALSFNIESEIEIRVGRLGQVTLKPGGYLYVGSALGPGGLQARVSRHLGPVPSKHWHIDYLHGVRRVSRVFLTYSQERLEHAWASAFLEVGGWTAPIPGFGSSDCRCQAHLIFKEDWPNCDQLIDILRGASPQEAELHQIMIA